LLETDNCKEVSEYGPPLEKLRSRSVRVDERTRREDVRDPPGSPLDLKPRFWNFGGELDPFHAIVCMLSMGHKMTVIEAGSERPGRNGGSKVKPAKPATHLLTNFQFLSHDICEGRPLTLGYDLELSFSCVQISFSGVT
jgi:hypothetical protein